MMIMIKAGDCKSSQVGVYLKKIYSSKNTLGMVIDVYSYCGSCSYSLVMIIRCMLMAWQAGKWLDYTLREAIRYGRSIMCRSVPTKQSMDFHIATATILVRRLLLH
jgi:hypothetical protein